MVSRFFYSIILGVSFFSASSIYAADENMNSSVYLAFDPVTGQFKEATKTPEEMRQSDDSVVNALQSSDTVAQAPSNTSLLAAEQMVGGEMQESGQGKLTWIFGAIALALVCTVLFVKRKSQGKTAQ